MEEGEGSLPFPLHSLPSSQCPTLPSAPCLSPPLSPFVYLSQRYANVRKFLEASGWFRCLSRLIPMFVQVCWVFPLAILWTTHMALIEVRDLSTQSLEIRTWSEDLSHVCVPLTLLVWKATYFISEHWLYTAVSRSPLEFQSKHCYERPLQSFSPLTCSYLFMM